MYTVESVELKDVHVFRHAVAPFAKSPLTFIRGLNKNTDKVAPSSNAVGKTLLVSAVPNLFHGSPPTANKKRGNTDMLPLKTSSITIKARPHADAPLYEITQTRSGYKILEDGRDLQLKGKTAPIEKLRQLFPQPAEIYYTIHHVSSLREYALQTNTPSDRLQLLVNMFNLDQYTAIKQEFEKRLRNIKDLETQLAVREARVIKLRAELRELRGTASKMTADDARAASSEADELAQQIKVEQERLYDLGVKANALRDLQDIEEHLDSMRKEYKRFKTRMMPDDYRKELKAALRSAHELAEYERSLARYKQRRARMEEQLDKHRAALDTKLSKAKLEARITKLEGEFDAAREAEREYEKHSSKYSDLCAQIKELEDELSGDVDEQDIKALDVDALRSDLEDVRVQLRLQTFLDKHGDCTQCPTCQQDVDIAAIKKLAKRAAQKKARIEEQLEQVEAFANLSALRAERKKLGKPQAPETSSAELEAEFRKLRAYIVRHSEIEILTASLEAQVAPEKPDQADDLGMSVEELEERIDFCERITRKLHQRDGLVSKSKELKGIRSGSSVVLELESVSKESAELKATLEELTELQSSHVKRVQQYEAYVRQRRFIKEQLREEQEEIDKARPVIEKKRAYEVLIKAYGSKGLRAHAVRSVCELIVNNMNMYRPLAFVEPFKFSVEVDETGVHILVDRGAGKPPTDVRFLSGAESNSFRLLCLASILPLVPASRRFNFVILDEPCSHMCPRNRELIMTRFIPALREIVPNIYIITPNSDDVSANSAEWLVVKSGAVSSLKEM